MADAMESDAGAKADDLNEPSDAPGNEDREYDDLPLETALAWFSDYEQVTANRRAEAESWRDYYDGIQWTASEIAKLEKRGQPVVTHNRIKSKVDYVLGAEIMSRTDPKAYPRTKAHEEAAEAATEALNYACDAAEFPTKNSRCFSSLCVEGVCAATVTVENIGDEVDIKIDDIPWDRLWYDPHTRKPDYSDAKYKGIVLMMDEEDALERWPDKEAEIQGAYQSLGLGGSQTFDDKPTSSSWANQQRKRMRFAAVEYRRKGKIWYGVFSKFAWVEGPFLSTYVDDRKRSTGMIVMHAAYVDRQLQPYGIVRALISPQDEINKRRSKALHLLSQRQSKSTADAVDDIRQVKQELAKPDGHVVYRKGAEFEILPTGDLATGQLALLQDAKNEIDAIGANASLTGKDPRDLSGIAIARRQAGGNTELAPIVEEHRMFKREIITQIWYRVRQFWTYEKWIRVTDDIGKVKWVVLNQPMTLRMALIEAGHEIPPQIENDPRLETIVGRRNNVVEMNLDIRIDEMADLVTLQMETFAQLVEMVKAGIQIPGDVIVESSNIRNKKSVLDRLRPSPEALQAQAAMQQQAQAIQIAGAQAKNQKTQAETLAILAKHHITLDTAPTAQGMPHPDSGPSPLLQQ